MLDQIASLLEAASVSNPDAPSFIIEIMNLSLALRLITTVMMPEPVKDSV